MDRIRILYIACLAILAVGMAAELRPALQGRAVDLGGILRLLVLVSVTGLLMLIRARKA